MRKSPLFSGHQLIVSLSVSSDGLWRVRLNSSFCSHPSISSRVPRVGSSEPRAAVQIYFASYIAAIWCPVLRRRPGSVGVAPPAQQKPALASQSWGARELGRVLCLHGGFSAVYLPVVRKGPGQDVINSSAAAALSWRGTGLEEAVLSGSQRLLP